MNAVIQKYREQFPRYKAIFSLGILVIVYTVGIIGLQTRSSDWFLAATPITLLLSAGALLWNHRDWNFSFAIVLTACLLIGYFVEVAGVETGIIFGNYWYGTTLGPKLIGVPLIISVNWLLLVYCTGMIVAPARWPGFVKAAVSATLMTGLDVLIEPVAMHFDFWQWQDGIIPWQNYLAWFGISFALLLLFHYSKFEKQNRLGFGIYVIQVIFFGTLNLTH